jgi:hypothetical protein
MFIRIYYHCWPSFSLLSPWELPVEICNGGHVRFGASIWSTSCIFTVDLIDLGTVRTTQLKTVEWPREHDDGPSGYIIGISYPISGAHERSCSTVSIISAQVN